MSNKGKTEIVTCEKFINKMLKTGKTFSTKTSPAAAVRHEKPISVIKPSPALNTQRTKQKLNSKQQSGVPKLTQLSPPLMKSKEYDGFNCHKESPKRRSHSRGSRCRYRSRSQSLSSDRDSWGYILHKNRSKQRISNFNHFDPLRTIHFLSNELNTRLQNLLPDDNSVMQMISDIQLSLKRIPKEITSLLQHDAEKLQTMKIGMINKSCQTPPTLYQEDTEKFQKIMEENTYRLEAGCKQLEMVCLNLQKEKELAENQLEEAKEHLEMLHAKIKNLEYDVEQKTAKILELERDKTHLQQELNRTLQEINSNGTATNLKNQLEGLQKQKAIIEENYNRLEYEMTLLKMEKEKLMTILSVRDREIKKIQNEMSTIQEQVTSQLTKLNTEVLPKVNHLKTLSDPSFNIKGNRNFCENVGDATISSINTNDSDKEPTVVLKELLKGDGECPVVHQESEDKCIDDFIESFAKLKTDNVQPVGDVIPSTSFEDLLKKLNPLIPSSS